MILESLVRLAEREGLVESPNYEYKEVQWRINIKRDGRFVSLESLLQESKARESKVKSLPRGRHMLVPRPLPGAAGTGTTPDAPFLVGNPSFVLGLDLTPDKKYESKKGELVRRAGEFARLVADAASRTGDFTLTAVRDFLVSRDRCEIGRLADKEMMSNHLIAFRVIDTDEEPVHLRPAVIQYWNSFCDSKAAEDDVTQCLITGQMAPVTDKHPPIKKLRGASRSGVAIVSFNQDAFESYGWRRNENAPVSRNAANAYTAALNRLLDPALPNPRRPAEPLPLQHVVLTDDTTVVFWADSDSPVPSLVVPAISWGDPEAARALGVTLILEEWCREGTEELARTEALETTLTGPWKGIRPQDLSDHGEFRLMVLSGAQGRATVRGFNSSRIADTVAAVRMWFDDIRIIGFSGKPAMVRLMSSLGVQGRTDALAPNLAGEVFMCALTGLPLPNAVLEMAVRRCRTEQPRVRPERAALLKAYLNRARSHLALSSGVSFEEVTVTVNDQERNRGYLLGRMFACIEFMQELALGDVGASITDRYFSAACATPQAVFPRLLKSEIHHFRKARDGSRAGTARWLHGEVSKLASLMIGNENKMQERESLDDFLQRTAGRSLTGFPSFLPLPEQGLFALGYHHQRMQWFTRRDAE